jgi:hypothetical protein
MTRQVRIGLLLSLTITVSLVLVYPAQAQKAAAQSMPMESDQMTNIPFFTLRDGMSSTLTLNNVDGLNPTKVTVTIYSMEGRALKLPPITLPPASVTKINLADVIMGEEFDSGNIQVTFQGIPMAVTCQVSVSTQRVSFESREQDMMDFRSASLNGILSLPRPSADGFLAVTNVAKNRVTVQLTVGLQKEDIPLFSRETRLVKLNEQHDKPLGLATLVKLQHNGLPGDVITTGFVLDMKAGYSSSFAMTDPLIARSSTLAGAHFRSGRPDPSEGFPESTQFRSPLLLANVSNNPVTAHLSVGYTVQEHLNMTPRESRSGQEDPTKQDKFSNLAIKDLTIAPGAVERIELSAELSRHGATGPFAEAGVDIAYDASPGSVIGQLVSVDQSGDYSFEVPIKDPSAATEMIEGAYPWSLENGTSTVVHLKNVTDKGASALLVLRFPGGGSYSPGRIVLKPYESIAIDIQKLKDSKHSDVLNLAFPSNATHGLLFWHQEIPRSMIGRAEETNVKTGIASSFSCNTGCCDHYQLNGFYLSPNPLNGTVPGTGTISGKEDYVSCGNTHYTAANAVANSWTSDSTAVASVNGAGTVTYNNNGSTTLHGNFNYHIYFFSDFCDEIYPYPTSTVGGTVSVTCGDTRDALIPEYPSYSADFTPVCTDFTSSASSAHYTFPQYNVSDASHYPGYAILRSYFLSGVESTVSHYGSAPGMNSGYRSPLINHNIDPNAPGSRHIHGDAADLASSSSTWTSLHNAAKLASACVEPESQSGAGHVHADWRGSCPSGW